MRKISLAAAVVLVASVLPVVDVCAAAFKPKAPIQKSWPFEGVFGRFDQPAIQRGFKVYKEVCSSCHSLKRVAFRNLTSVGFSEAEVKELAKSYEIDDGPNEDGEMFKRPGIPADHLPGPFPNKKAAAAANNGAIPPDLSLIVKARPGGANYLYSLLVGYKSSDPNKNGLYENDYFPSGAINMAPPLSDDQVDYSDDGTKPTVANMAYDVVNFLQWAAEPEMQERHAMGITAISFVVIMTILSYFAYKEIWKSVDKD